MLYPEKKKEKKNHHEYTMSVEIIKVVGDCGFCSKKYIKRLLTVNTMYYMKTPKAQSKGHVSHDL